MANPNRDPHAADYDRFIAQTKSEGATVESGSVTLVGAGPGDPELLTLRAVRALQSADVILIDDLVSSEVLDFARREAKKMLVGKTGHGPACKQDEINALMISLAKAGKRVVRLKGGDPMIFGRGGEEVRACRMANIPVEVVPGISAAQAVASRLGVSLTHRKHARRVQFVTGHGEDGKLPDDLDWNSLSRRHRHHGGLYAAEARSAIWWRTRSRPGSIRRRLRLRWRARRGRMRVSIAAPVAELPARLSAEAPSGPVLVLIGHVLAERASESVAEWLGGKKAASNH